MIRIAITQRLMLNETYYELRESLDIKWGELFNELKFLPVVFPYNYDFKDFDFDGVILSGGNDIGEFELRDKFELKLIEYAIQNNIPVFGVCRGMQIIAKYFDCNFTEVKNQVAIYHKLSLNKNSKYYSYLRNINEVNSFHNIAVKNIPSSLIVSAWNDDKSIIKALEHKKYKIFGQMWHSEREKPFKKEELEMISEFFS